MWLESRTRHESSSGASRADHTVTGVGSRRVRLISVPSNAVAQVVCMTRSGAWTSSDHRLACARCHPRSRRSVQGQAELAHHAHAGSPDSAGCLTRPAGSASFVGCCVRRSPHPRHFACGQRVARCSSHTVPSKIDGTPPRSATRARDGGVSPITRLAIHLCSPQLVQTSDIRAQGDCPRRCIDHRGIQRAVVRRDSPV